MTNGIDLKGGKMIYAWVEYKNNEKAIRVWVGYEKVKPDSPVLVAPIDLSKRFNGLMYVGFTASNGIKGSSVHLIHSWEFKTVENDPVNEVEELGSDTCQAKSPFKLALGLFVVNMVLILSFCLLGLYVCWSKTRGRTGSGLTRPGLIISEPDGNSRPRRLKYSEIRLATRGFNRNMIIGEGSKSTVYGTTLPNTGNVAVKRINKIGPIGSQFVTEFVTIAGEMRHKNLINLNSWCYENNELILVYEYMTNGSLDKHLHTRTANAINTIKFSFESRLNVLVGVANALVYLHDELDRPVIHRNVKTSNILLDANLAPKLGFFEMTSRDVTLTSYLAPEYVYSRVATVKTDVYSFGVVVLEVATGRQAVDEAGVTVVDWVWDLWEEKRLVDCGDSNLFGEFNRIDMELMLMIGLICVHPNYEMRPVMKDVVKMLRGEIVPDLPDVKPTVLNMIVHFRMGKIIDCYELVSDAEDNYSICRG
ncbi:concanavalin A-like lectin/glucanase domain, Ephrin type-A receptor 8 [Artemisia annua]|uniref:Concanavalin A-like lectin/glucanase domain, Ephrin type-A receptor 8 n=1 Tax=Artemisia annua TaxID=35608 RepID=A0A2U1P8F3_ARTAN|nr:concanavalin A-like lectin/glucanase domain, Ephrin type-A receptor 8 [Artemisia annua]